MSIKGIDSSIQFFFVAFNVLVEPVRLRGMEKLRDTAVFAFDPQSKLDVEHAGSRAKHTAF